MSKDFTLKPLEVNECETFSSPLEGNDVFVRTGCKGSLFEAVLRCCDKNYIIGTENERDERVRKIVSTIITKEVWEGVNTNTEDLSNSVSDTIDGVYLYFENDEEPTDKLVKKVLKKINSNKKVYKVILGLVKSSEIADILKSHCGNMSLFQDYVINEIGQLVGEKNEIKKVSDTRRKSIIKLFEELLIHTIKACKNTLYKSQKHNIELDSIIPQLAEHLQRDIYVINEEQRIPIESYTNSNEKAVIILRVEDGKYETVGRLLLHDRIQRDFLTDDVLVRKCDMFLNDVSEVREKYKELAPYTYKKEEEKNVEISCSASDDGSDSDSESDSESDDENSMNKSIDKNTKKSSTENDSDSD